MKKRRKTKGVTLLELIISLAILSIVITPMFSLAVSSAKINGKSEDEIQSLALAQRKFEFLKSNKDVLSELNQTYVEDGFIVTEEIVKVQKYEVSGNEGSNPVIPKGNIINVELKKENGKYILDASNNSESKNYEVKSNYKIKIFYKNNAINFENNGNKLSIKVDLNFDVKINFINNTGNNFEVSFNNQNYIKQTDEIYIYYAIGNNITIKKDSDGVMEHNDDVGGAGSYGKFTMYKTIVKVSKNGKIYQTFEGYKPIYD